jgi:CheY-like chemotaxis protein
MADMDGAALGERINADHQLSQARIVMLTSVDERGDARRFAALGFAAYLTKPVRSAELLECLDRVLACEAKQWHLQSQPIVTRGSLSSTESAARYRGRILLVEDNPVNQKVAVRLLERMGCSVRVADNGAEGVKAFAESMFDLVLMDLQMPVMDGLTATRRIREFEGDRAPTPIVALTANAMAGQLERCLDAGMTAFLTKPIDVARLHETLERYGLVAQRNAHGAPIDGRAPSVPVDLARLNEITENDPEFAYELASTFIASGEQVLDEIHTAISVFDRSALSRAAHKLKGASANIHAEALCSLALKLEMQAPQLDQPRLKELIEELRLEFDRAAEFLQQQTPAPAAKAG